MTSSRKSWVRLLIATSILILTKCSLAFCFLSTCGSKQLGTHTNLQLVFQASEPAKNFSPFRSTSDLISHKRQIVLNFAKATKGSGPITNNEGRTKSSRKNNDNKNYKKKNWTKKSDNRRNFQSKFRSQEQEKVKFSSRKKKPLFDKERNDKKMASLIAVSKTKLQEMQSKLKNKESLTQQYCDEIMGLCVAANNWDEVLNILEIMKSQQLSQQLSTYRACLCQCYKVANVDSAMSILEAMDQANVRPEGQDLGTATATLCKLGNWRRAMHLVKQSTEKNSDYLFSQNEENKQSGNQIQIESKPDPQNFIIPIENYNAIFYHMSKSKNWKEALQLLSLMESSSPTSMHPKPNLSTYNLILEACSHASQPEQAMQILQTMSSPKINLPPNTHSYNLVIAACLKKRHWRRAIKVLEMMSESDPPVKQTTVTYNSVISCCAKAGEVHHAISLLKTMRIRNVKPDTVTYNAVMTACASSFKTCKDALTLLDDLNREPGVDPDIVTYTIAIRACSKGGKTERGLAIFQMMKDRNMKLDVYVYTSIMDLCAKAGMWRQSIDFLDEMRGKGIMPNGFTYSVAIAACGKGGQWERSLELLHQMKDKGIRINTITYNSAIAALANASSKTMRQALKEERSKTYLNQELENGEIISPGSKSSTFASFGQFKYEENHLWRKALDLIQQMQESGVQPDAITYSSAIKACGAAGQWKEALEIISIMKKGGPSTRPNRISYTNAITACGRSGEYEHALRLFNDMKRDGLQPDRVSYNALISALKSSNQPQKVFQLWNEMCGNSVTEDGAEKVIATASPDARKIAPDIITVTDTLYALERSNIWREKSDMVFEEAVKRKILFKPTTYSLDTVWEVDLSGMSFPVAHAAIRFALNRATISYFNDGELEDFTFITGVGSGQNHRSNDRGNDEHSLIYKAPLSLRDFIRESLNNEFEPSIFAVVPKYALGTVVIGKDILKKWMDAKSLETLQ